MQCDATEIGSEGRGQMVPDSTRSLRKMISSLSCDLDDKWSYMKTHGDQGWETLPSYLDIVVPRILSVLKQFNLPATFFIVGKDAAIQRNHKLFRSLGEEGHEIANHSHKHEPWLHLYSQEEMRLEIAKAEDHIMQATGQRPVGFRGPGYSLSGAAVSELVRRGYLYDATSFPSLLTPLVRMYYFATADLTPDEKHQRKSLGGKLRDGLRPTKPYYWCVDGKQLLEIPVTTLPIFKLPMHMSYLFGLKRFSSRLAMAYFNVALRFCRLSHVEPSIVLHPTDFLGREDGQGLQFIPGMGLASNTKLKFVCEALERLRSIFSVVTLREHAIEASQTSNLRRFTVGS
jgi:peptidoglycan/xylan/chitin deacetylase (PgdA/CDA1 family)